MTRRFLSLAYTAAAVLMLTAPAAAGGLGQTAQPTDATLTERIEYRLETAPTVRKYDVKVKVDAGIATLSGKVATAAQKDEAVRIAGVEGVRRVESNIEVTPDADKTLADRTKAGLNKAGDKINDGWITTKVKWFVMRDDLLDDSEINVDTRDHVVTLKGTVPTAAGRQRAKELARDTEGVKQVVDQLTIAAKK